MRKFYSNVYFNVPGPGSGAFLTLDLGSGIGFFPDPGFKTHIFDSLMTSTIILSVLLKKFSLPVQKLNYLQFSDICGFVAQQMVGQNKFPLLFWCCCCIRDPGLKKIRIRDPG